MKAIIQKIKMKKLLVALVAILTIAISANAQAEENMFSGTAKAGLYSSYVAGVTGVTFHKNPLLQQSLTVTHNPSGAYVSLWSSYCSEKDFGREIDYTAGICRPVGPLQVDISYSYYNLIPISTFNGDLHALVMNVDFPKVGDVTPFINLEQDLPVNKDVLPGGFLYKVGGKFEIAGVNCALYAGGHDGAYGIKRETVSIIRLNGCYDLKFDTLTVTPAVGLQVPVQAKVDTQVIGSVVASYHF